MSKFASTSRVLNIHRIAELYSNTEEHGRQPFFNDTILNTSIIAKHRLRPDEAYLMPKGTTVATKIIFPFVRTELRVGGQSMMVGQRGFRQTILEFLGPETPTRGMDIETLDILAGLPSLDPFLLRENLMRQGRDPASCYFEISPSDQQRMRIYVNQQIRELISLALDGSTQSNSNHINKLVDAILAIKADARLDPLRATLGLDGPSFDEGIFNWRGFLYYKWQFTEIVSPLKRVLQEVDQVRLLGRPSGTVLEAIELHRNNLKKAIKVSIHECMRSLGIYDQIFRALVDHGNAKAFRDFLLDAPQLFAELGKSMGVISHIVSFWGYKFPEPESLDIQTSDFLDLICEFEVALTAALIKDRKRI